MIGLRTILISLLIGIPIAVSAQSDTLSFFSIQEVYKQNSWLSASNPIGISFNRFTSFSIAEANYSYSKGNFGNSSLPSAANVYSVSSESFQTLNKLSLYGRLDYTQNHNRAQNWNGMTNDYWQAVNLCDSVNGKRRSEAYRLAGIISLPLNSHWLIGTKVDYQVQMTAKDTDPRNKNEWSGWELIPGLGYKYGDNTFGVSLAYANKKETVDYRNMGTHATYSVFAEYPLSFFNTYPKDENIKWYYTSQEMSTALQVDIAQRNYHIFQELKASLIKQEIEGNRIQNHKEGETDMWRVDYLGKLKKHTPDTDHEWSLLMSYEKVNNYDPLQQQEESGVWKSYGNVLRSTRQRFLCNLDYEYRCLHNGVYPHFSVLSGIRYRHQENALLFYPIRYVQPLEQFMLYSTFTYNFFLPKGFLDCSAGGRYDVGSGTMMQEKRLATNSGTEEVKLWQSTERLQQNFDYETMMCWTLNASVEYTHKTPLCWFVKLAVSYEHSNKCLINENNKKIVASIGLIF